MLRWRSCSFLLLAGRCSVSIPENQEGGIASADSSTGQKHQRVQMKYNRVNNLLMACIVVLPVGSFLVFSMSKYSNVWVSWRDPYEMPLGFDPNKDPPPKLTSQETVATRPSMMTATAPGQFGVINKTEDSTVS